MAIPRGITPGQPGNIPVPMRFDHKAMERITIFHLSAPNVFQLFIFLSTCTTIKQDGAFIFMFTRSETVPDITDLSKLLCLNMALAPHGPQGMGIFVTSPIHGVKIDIDLPWGLTTWDDRLSYIDRSRSFFFIHCPGVTVAILNCYVFAP